MFSRKVFTLMSLFLIAGLSCNAMRYNPIFGFARNGNIKEIKRLIDGGTSINIRDDFENTMLHYAAKYNQIKMVTWLLRKGARIDLENCNLEIPSQVKTSKNIRWIFELYELKIEGKKSKRIKKLFFDSRANKCDGKGQY